MDDDIVTVLNIDSPVINGFDQIDKSCSGQLLQMIQKVFHEQGDFIYQNNSKWLDYFIY